MGIQYYTNCRCPECKYKLDEVPITTQTCPVCSKPLEPQRVWETRSYPGNVILPYWISAFGWPALVIAIGLAGDVWSYHSHVSRFGMRGFGAITGFGIIWFIVKLAGADR